MKTITAIKRAKKIGLRFEVSRFCGNASAAIDGTDLRFMLWESAGELLYSASFALEEIQDKRAKAFRRLAESCQDCEASEEKN